MLLGLHDLEALEVRGVITGLLGLKLLRPSSGSPLLLNLGLREGLAEGRQASTTRDRDGEVGKSEALEVDDLAGNAGAAHGAVNVGLWSASAAVS